MSPPPKLTVWRNEPPTAIVPSAATLTACPSSVDAALGVAEEPWTRLERAAAAHLEEILDRESGYASVVIRVLPADAPELATEMTDLRDRYEARFRNLVAALPLPATTDRTLFRMTLLGALNWTPVWYRPNQTKPDAIARAIVSMLRASLT